MSSLIRVVEEAMSKQVFKIIIHITVACFSKIDFLEID